MHAMSAVNEAASTADTSVAEKARMEMDSTLPLSELPSEKWHSAPF